MNIQLLLKIIFLLTFVTACNKKTHVNILYKNVPKAKADKMINAVRIAVEPTRKSTEAANKASVASAENRTNNRNNVDSTVTASISSLPEGDLKNDMSKRWKILKGDQENIIRHVEDIKSSLEVMGGFLTPENIKRLSDSLLYVEVIKTRKDNNGQEISSEQRIEIVKRVAVKLTDLIEIISKKQLAANEELDVWAKKEDNLAFEIKVITDNITLRNYLWGDLSIAYFGTDSFQLNHYKEQALLHNLNYFFSRLLIRLNELVKTYDTTQDYEVVVNIFVKGYADTRPYKNCIQSESDQLNLVLSQNRSDEILRIILDVWNQNLSQINLTRIHFGTPTTSSEGMGLMRPNAKVQYKPYKTRDNNRMVASLTCSFYVRQIKI